LLIVEDDHAVFEAARRMLSADFPKLEIVPAYSKATALALVRSELEIVVALIDLHLGPQSPQGGLEVAASLREHQPRAAIAIWSGLDATASSAQAGGAHFPFIPKASVEAMRAS
jgi:DNA-binding NarL/FixJ family response regulator